MGPSHKTSLTLGETRILALTQGCHRLYLVGLKQAPLWVRARGPWRRTLNVTWQRIVELPGHWWFGQNGQQMAILGQGARPALVIARADTSWRALVPAGYRSVMILLPDGTDYRVYPASQISPSHPGASHHSI